MLTLTFSEAAESTTYCESGCLDSNALQAVESGQGSLQVACTLPAETLWRLSTLYSCQVMPKIAYGAMLELPVSQAVLVREKALQHRRTSVPSFTESREIRAGNLQASAGTALHT